MYASPRFDQENDQSIYGSSPQLPRARRQTAGPTLGMSSPYGADFSRGYAPTSPQMPMQQQSGPAPSMPQAPSPYGSPSIAQAPMDMETRFRLMNQGNIARGPSPGSTLARVEQFANNPQQGQALATMSQQRGSPAAWAAPFAASGQLGAGLAPTLTSNRIGNANASVAEQTAPYAPRFADQQLRGETIQNDNAASLGPARVGLVTAQTGDVAAHGRLNDAQAQNLPAQMKSMQDELHRHQTENQQLRSQLAHYQQQEAAAAKAAAGQQQTTARADQQQRNFDNTRVDHETDRIIKAAGGGINDAAPSPQQAREKAYDNVGLRGSPTTQPVPAATHQQPQPAAQGAPSGASLPQGATANGDGSMIYNGKRYVRGTQGGQSGWQLAG